jgi:hypothetical protein
MIYTERQLQQMHKAHGRVVLPYRARLTPLAQDWIRARKIVIGYSDAEALGEGEPPGEPRLGRSLALANRQSPAIGDPVWLWWCDGPCGPAKAALLSVAREMGLAASSVGNHSKHLVEAVKQIATQANSGKVIGGVLLVSSASAALVYANRCRSLRAIVGTCLESVEHGLATVAANVLMIEHPHQSLSQVRNMLLRFCKARRELAEDVSRSLTELGTCG